MVTKKEIIKDFIRSIYEELRFRFGGNLLGITSKYRPLHSSTAVVADYIVEAVPIQAAGFARSR